MGSRGMSVEPHANGASLFLLTDYGMEDELAGMLRATLARLCPAARVIDITHGIPAFDVRAGSFCLERAVPYLGPGIVIAVVDPGVATGRRAVAVQVDPSRIAVPPDAPGGLAGPNGLRSPGLPGGPGFYIGPDNGLLARAVRLSGGAVAVVEIATSGRSTFDGRDVFAPAAAKLFNGAPLRDLGDLVDPSTLVVLDDPLCETGFGTLRAEVTWVDRFGNVQLAACPDDARASGIDAPDSVLWLEQVRTSELRERLLVQRVDSYDALATGELGLLVDANGHLAVVCRRQSAALLLGIVPGMVIALTAAERPQHDVVGQPAGGGVVR
ncbi:MAG: SAM hydrolase/SAM-dependent halogenase family protein [Acidimicrobiales bacterium]